MKTIKIIAVIVLINFTTSCINSDTTNWNRNNNKEYENYIKVDVDEKSDNIKKRDDTTKWNISKVEGKIIFFDNGKFFDTKLFDLQYIGHLKTKHKVPYFILSGRSCNNCDENISIYIWSPSDGEMNLEGKHSRYSYPGKEENYLTNELVFESRMFYGDCLGVQSCVWVQKSEDNKKIWPTTIHMVYVESDVLKEIALKESDKNFDSIMKKMIFCNELQGVTTTTEP